MVPAQAEARKRCLLMSSKCCVIDVSLTGTPQAVSSKTTKNLVVPNFGCRYFVIAERTLFLNTAQLFFCLKFLLNKYCTKGLVLEAVHGMFSRSQVALCEASALIQSSIA